MKILAVIYANENNIWDNQKREFHFGKNFDEKSYAIPLQEAEETLKYINQERLEAAYLVELPESGDE